MTTATSTREGAAHELPNLPMRETFARTVSELMDDHPALGVVLADISTDLFRTAARRHPGRVVNVGIREQLAVNVGAGMALAGMRPIVHTFAPFLVERAFEQVKLGFGHQDVGGVLVSAGASYDYARSGRTHQGPGDVALLDTLPGWTVHVPGHAAEVDAILRLEASATGRVYVRTSTESNAWPMPAPGMQVVARGSRGTVVAVGPMLDATLQAVEGLDLTVLYTATVRPFAGDVLRATLGEPDVVLVEPLLAGTSVRAATEALVGLRHRVLGIGVPRTEFRHYGTPDEHARAHGLDAQGIRDTIHAFLG